MRRAHTPLERTFRRHTLQTKPSPITTSLVSARLISLRMRVGWAVCRARVPAQDSVRGRSPAETPNPSPLYPLYPYSFSTTSLSHGVGRPRPTAQRGHPVPHDRIDHRRLCQSPLPPCLQPQSDPNPYNCRFADTRPSTTSSRRSAQLCLSRTSTSASSRPCELRSGLT